MRPGPRRPRERDAAQAVRAGLGAEPRDIERMTTGITHYVYAVTTTDERRVVVRLTTADTSDWLAGGVYWHERLRAVGAPLAALLHADLAPTSGFPYMLLERLPGQDLEYVYEQMSREQRHALAVEIVALQRAVATLPHAAGYGFARAYDDPGLSASWRDVVLASLERSRQRILVTGVVSPERMERVRAHALAISEYLEAVPPVAFLDDTTTKNVLVHEGRLSGVVDTDCVCFGDPLFTLAITRVALVAHGHDTEYTDAWQDLLALNADQRRALSVYVAVFCLDLMSEFGQQFNQDEPLPTDDAFLRRLDALLDETLANP